MSHPPKSKSFLHKSHLPNDSTKKPEGVEGLPLVDEDNAKMVEPDVIVSHFKYLACVMRACLVEREVASLLKTWLFLTNNTMPKVY